jgi:COP9 signalosome complex subunit 1
LKLFQNWSHVISYVNKALATPDFAEGTMKGVDNNNLLTGLNCAYGLAELATRKYKSAAKRFLMAQLDHCNIPDIMSTQVIYSSRLSNSTSSSHLLY